MLSETWSNKSRFLLESIRIKAQSFITNNQLNYEITEGMSGFNDRLVICDKSNEDDYYMISFIIGWFNADSEVAYVHKFNKGKEHEYVTHKYLDFDNNAFKDEVDEERFNGYLKNNDIKYYRSPFDMREDEITEDIFKLLSIKMN